PASVRASTSRTTSPWRSSRSTGAMVAPRGAAGKAPVVPTTRQWDFDRGLLGEPVVAVEGEGGGGSLDVDRVGAARQPRDGELDGGLEGGEHLRAHALVAGRRQRDEEGVALPPHLRRGEVGAGVGEVTGHADAHL